MGIAREQVFLVQGQRQNEAGTGLNGAIEQIVVVAHTWDDVRKLLDAEAPGFQIVGSATLKDYETTAARIREVLNGKSTEWPVRVAPGIDLK